jgi:membrane-associated phospholipid phosphatase
MGRPRGQGGSFCRNRLAALALVWLLGVLTAHPAAARGPWCDDLPASLETLLEDVGCDTASSLGPVELGQTGLARLAAEPHFRSFPDPLAPLLRLPAAARGAQPLPPVAAHYPEGAALIERGTRELLVRMGVLASVSTVLLLTVEPPRSARWTATPSLDDAARRGLRARSRGGRRAASLSSSLLLAGLGAQLMTDWWLQRDVYPAFRSVSVDTSWLMLNEIANRAAKTGAGRQRPYVGPCGSDPKYVDDCNDGRNDNASFYSGHASWSASLAGLVCARRQAVEHSDDVGVRWGDVAWCGLAVTASLATGLLRVVADRHHLSDVGAGWTAGFLTGFVLPRVFDYRSGAGGPFSRFRVTPLQREDSWGLAYSIEF